MKRTLLIVVLMVVSGRSLAVDVAWQRGDYMADHAVAEPWKSSGLGPVVMTPLSGVAQISVCAQGKAALPIVIPVRGKPGSEYYRQVAEFLRKYLNAATGASFRIVEDTTAPDTGIFVGPCDRAGGEALIDRAAGLAPEYFIFRAAGGSIALIGRDISDQPGKPLNALRMTSRRQSRGTFFAAIDFLERFIGVRFYMPGELGVHIPYLERQQVAVPSVTYTDGPVFEQRLSSYGNYLTQDHELLGYTRKQGVAWMIALRTAD